MATELHQMTMGTKVTAFVHSSGDWDSSSRSHPALAWFEPVVRDIFDAHLWDTPYSDIYTDQFQLLKPDGTEVTNGKEAWAHIAQMYGPFTKQRTRPFYMVTMDTDYGWEMIGNAWIFGDFPGNPGPGEQKVKDIDGQEWDCKMAGGYRFQFVKNAGGPRDGILCRMVQIMTDTAPIMMKMLGRGLVKPSDLGLG